jgi:hypothetical protein
MSNLEDLRPNASVGVAKALTDNMDVAEYRGISA